MDNFAEFVDKLGKDICVQGDELRQNSNVIDPAIDTQIFIETNKTNNKFPIKEVFQEFDEKASFSPDSNQALSTASDSKPYGTGEAMNAAIKAALAGDAKGEGGNDIRKLSNQIDSSPDS